MKTKLSGTEIEKLDPYQFMAALGKKIIHPGGKKSTEELYAMAELQPDFNVLEIGCGVGSTAIDIVKRFGCNITITDIDDNMIYPGKEEYSGCNNGGKNKSVESGYSAIAF